jgi:hypothetical protein
MKYIIQFILVAFFYYPFTYMFGASLEGCSYLESTPLALILTFGTYCQDVYRKENKELDTN